MTVNTTSITSGPYTGNGITTSFSYGFKVQTKNDIQIYETNLAGDQYTLVVDTDYTVNNIGQPGGGTVTRVAGPLPIGWQWYMRAAYKQTQDTSFTSQGAFFPDLHENAIDKMTFLIQQLQDGLDRSLRFESSYNSGGAILPPPEAYKLMRWRGDLLGFENIDISTIDPDAVVLTDYIKKVDTFAAISSIDLALNEIFILKGHTSPGIGGGIFYGDSSGTPDGGLVSETNTIGVFAKRIINGPATIQMFGGGLGTNDQAAIEALYEAVTTAYIPAGEYYIDNLRIRKPFTLKTDGFLTKLLQNPGVTGTNQQISVITVAASDVKIEDISLVGNIATDTGQDRHGIRVDASTVPGGISKIHIGNVSASNMRGDGVVFFGTTDRDISDFSVGNIFGFNIFRNGCSVVSGKNGKIGVVSVAGEGLFAFDSEPDTSGGVVENITVAGVYGRHCGVPAVASVQKGVTFGFVDLDWTLPQSTPAFSPVQESEENGIVYRSTNGCHIEYCRLRNFPESPIRIFKEASDAYVDNISFGTLIIENCLTAVSDPPCLIRASGVKNIVIRGTLKYTCTSSALHELILDGAATGLVRLSANRIEGNAPIGRYISVDCQSSEIAYGDDRSCLIFTGNCTFNNAVWDVGIIASSSVGLLTFTSSSLKWTGSFKYSDGITTNFHTYELNSLASATVGATPTWAATRVDS